VGGDGGPREGPCGRGGGGFPSVGVDHLARVCTILTPQLLHHIRGAVVKEALRYAIQSKDEETN
jgi:hypothetical protein